MFAQENWLIVGEPMMSCLFELIPFDIAFS